MKQNKIKIAVTGGIGSGKSTVCNIIKSLGYPVYSCDEVYSQILKDKKVIDELSAEFGKNILNEDNSLNRKVLSDIVFCDEQKLIKLNQITHSKIFEEIFSISSVDSGLVFYEVPVLFEGGYQNLFDEILVVLRDEKLRMNSVIERDSITEQEVQNRFNKQFNYSKIDFAKYYVIHNCGNIDELTEQVVLFSNKIRGKYKL